MTAESIGKKLERSPTIAALQVVFDKIAGPLWLEEVLQGAGAPRKDKSSIRDQIDKLAGEFKVLAGLVEALAIQEPVALWAGWHWKQCHTLPDC